MNLAVIVAVLTVLSIFIVSGLSLRGFNFTTRRIARIGIFAAMAIILYTIKFVPFPQGGGISLLHILPIMLLSFMFGPGEGVICAAVVASLKLIVAKPLFLMQIPLDYYGAMLAVGFVGIVGMRSKYKMLVSSIVAGLLSTFCSVLSGVIFFGQYAPEGMNTWVYASIYNFTGYGVEVGLSIMVMMILPMTMLMRSLKLKSENEVGRER